MLEILSKYAEEFRFTIAFAQKGERIALTIIPVPIKKERHIPPFTASGTLSEVTAALEGTFDAAMAGLQTAIINAAGLEAAAKEITKNAAKAATPATKAGTKASSKPAEKTDSGDDDDNDAGEGKETVAAAGETPAVSSTAKPAKAKEAPKPTKAQTEAVKKIKALIDRGQATPDPEMVNWAKKEALKLTPECQDPEAMKVYVDTEFKKIFDKLEAGKTTDNGVGMFAGNQEPPFEADKPPVEDAATQAAQAVASESMDTVMAAATAATTPVAAEAMFPAQQDVEAQVNAAPTAPDPIPAPVQTIEPPKTPVSASPATDFNLF